MAALPVIDISPLLADEGSEGSAAGPAADEAVDAVVDQLRRVVHEVGFFYLEGHGVDPALADEVIDVARSFFALAEPDRLAVENVRSPQFRGYTRHGHELTNGVVDRRDQLDVGREQPDRWPGPDEPAWLRLRGPNLWPPALPAMRPVVTAWMDALEQVSAVLVRGLARAVGQPATTFDEVTTPAEVLLKVIRYQALPAGADPADAQGVGAHRDTGFVTIVHQDRVGGLQVERAGELIDVPARPGAFVVNIGEMFQLVTRGYFRATVHRVVSPPAGAPDRVSLAYFFNPRLEATLAPIDLPPALAAAAPGGDSEDPDNPILANYGDNSLKVRLRAHPDVAEAHHRDLLDAGTWSS